MPTSYRQLRQVCIAALDDGGAHQVTSSTSASVTCAALVNTTADASPARYNGTHLYLASGASGTAGQQRLATNDSYVPSTGTIGLTPAWGVVPVGGEILEITRLFPSSGYPVVSAAPGEDTSYRTLLRRALAKVAVPDRVLCAVGSHWQYPLTAYPWLTRQERLVRVLEPGPTGLMPVDAGWRGVALRLDGPTPHLEIGAPFSSASGALQLEVLRPSDTLVAVDGVWAESTTGPQNDSDLLLPDPSDVVAAFLAEAYTALTARSPGRPYPKAAELAEYWRGEAQKARYHDWTQDRPEAPTAQAGAA